MTARIHSVGLVPENEGLGYIEIPIEKLVNGEVVTVDTKSIPVISMTAIEAENYSDNGAYNMTAEERAEGIEGIIPDGHIDWRTFD